MLESLQPKHQTLDSEIVAELVTLLPDTWHSAILRVESLRFEGDLEQHRIIVTNPEQHQGVVMPSDKLCSSIRTLSLLFKKHKHPWKKITYNLSLNADDTWKYDVDYQH